jgi:hypothetical protein
LLLSLWPGCGALLCILISTSTSSLQAQNSQPWILGDCNHDGELDIADAVFALNHVFAGKNPDLCVPLCDNNNDSRLDISDPIALLRWIFLGHPLKGLLPPEKEFDDGMDNDCDGEIDEGCLSVSLRWDPVTVDVDGEPDTIAQYTVHVGEAPGNYSETVDAGKLTSVKVTGFQMTAFVPGVTYYFAVTARDLAGNTSDFSQEAAAMGK